MDDLARLRKDRGAKAKRTGVWGVIYQGVYAATQLVALGMLVRYVGREQYGLWMTILAVTTWAPVANLGQTSVLLTRLGALAHTDRPSAGRVFSASTVLVTSAAAVLLLIIALCVPLVSWSGLPVGDASLWLAQATAAVALTVSVLTLPAVFAGCAIFAHQRGDLVHMIMSAASLIGLAAMAIAMRLQQPLWVVGGLSLAGPLLGGLTLWWLGLATGLMPRPRWALVDRKTLTNLMKTGLVFFLTDAAAILLLRSPDVIVASVDGVDAVGPFASVGRLPLLLVAVFQAVLLPFWPALGEAAQRRDYEWIRRTARYTLVLVLSLGTLAAAGIGVAGTAVVEVWMGGPGFSTPGLLAAACLQTLSLGLFFWLFVLLGALSMQRQLAVVAGVTTLIFLPLAFLSGTWLGPVGVALAQALALLCCAVPLGTLVLYRYLAEHAPRCPPL
ncbi:oligosaccharide flippase family protein [uncultured Thiodictyon sp.]|jgi:O-antigen/teichoic acid export membrane protein|uniref:lipopolysaccharide biosynthesis protein n=1 Tax=uncultured Thiodictyon sp. TaxID=1846217 RepID=UPI0025F75B64|nr:oligosaccharide flippase family protein [uncultured Thiodictyon sp.]